MSDLKKMYRSHFESKDLLSKELPYQGSQNISGYSIYSIRFNQLDSTNLWAKTHAYSLAPFAITCITAQEQTAGRGRFARSWISPKGNIYASLFFSVPKNTRYLLNLSQLVSINCATVLEKKGFKPQIKWPNDILLSGKKVAGILTETVDLKERLGVVIGIGMNVNMSDAALESINQPATSLSQISNQEWKLEELLSNIISEFKTSLAILEKVGFSHFQPAYEERLALKGERIQCQRGDQVIEGICHSITNEGNLNLLLDTGEFEVLSSGEIKNFRKVKI